MGRGLQSRATRIQNRAIAAGRLTRGSSRAGMLDEFNGVLKGRRRTKEKKNCGYYSKKIMHDDNNYTIEYRFENEQLHIGNIFNLGGLYLGQILNSSSAKTKMITDNNLRRLLGYKLMITLRVEQAQAQS